MKEIVERLSSDSHPASETFLDAALELYCACRKAMEVVDRLDRIVGNSTHSTIVPTAIMHQTNAAVREIEDQLFAALRDASQVLHAKQSVDHECEGIVNNVGESDK